MSHSYPSDVSREQFNKIKPILESVRRKQKDHLGFESILEKVLKKLVGEARQNNARKEKTSFAIVDAQSLTNIDTAENKGYDIGEKSIWY